MSIWSWLRGIVWGPRKGDGVSPFPPGRGPARLVVMRHAEKTGKKSDHHLSSAGERRARDLVRYIPERFGRPDFLLAASRNPHSDRPRDTLVPLAEALGLDIASHIRDEDVEQVVALLSTGRDYWGKLGIISWRHSDLPALIATLGAPDGTFPAHWPEDEYELLVEIDYGRTGAPSVSRHIHHL